MSYKCIQKIESQKTTETDDDYLDDDFNFNDIRVKLTIFGDLSVLFDLLLEVVQFLQQERDGGANRDEDETKQDICYDQE